VYIVREDHSTAGERGGEPVNAIVAIDLDRPLSDRVLYDQSDFVAYPRSGPDGRLAFVAWNHPDMPWDATTLFVGRLQHDGLGDLRVVAGGPESKVSILEPVWDDHGTLYFLSDRSGYWNLPRWHSARVEAVTRIDADLGGPQWLLGRTTYALTGGGRALVRICRNAVDSLALVELATGRVSDLRLPFRTFEAVGVLDPHTGYAIAVPDDAPAALITFDLSSAEYRVVRSA